MAKGTGRVKPLTPKAGLSRDRNNKPKRYGNGGQLKKYGKSKK